MSQKPVLRLVVMMEICAGPAQDDSYTDLRSDYQQNEPAVDYNSGFTGESCGCKPLQVAQCRALKAGVSYFFARVCVQWHTESCRNDRGAKRIVACKPCAGVLAYLTGSPDSWDQCVARGDVVHTPQAVSNNGS